MRTDTRAGGSMLSLHCKALPQSSKFSFSVSPSIPFVKLDVASADRNAIASGKIWEASTLNSSTRDELID